METQTELEAREQILHDQLATAFRHFEDESRAFRSRYDAIAEALAATRAERDSALGHLSQLKGETPTDETASLRDQVSKLQEQVEILQQQRDDAVEQTGMLRLDRDRLSDALARLEARVKEVEGQEPAATPQPAIESADSQRALEASDPNAEEIRARLDSPDSPIDSRSRPEAALPDSTSAAADVSPCADDVTPSAELTANPEPPPLVRDVAPTDPAPALADPCECADPLPPPCIEDPPVCPGVEAPEEPESGAIAPPRPLCAESPEARILHLRNSLRVAHEARAKGFLSGPFFARLARIWERIGPAE